MDKRTWIYVSVFILIIVGLFAWYGFTPGQYDSFAQCLDSKGAKFYGAFWCPHCQDQKKLFGKSLKFVPYVECSTQDGKGQLEVCKEKGVQSYPTWIFENGNRQSGLISLADLSATTSCALK